MEENEQYQDDVTNVSLGNVAGVVAVCVIGMLVSAGAGYYARDVQVNTDKDASNAETQFRIEDMKWRAEIEKGVAEMRLKIMQQCVDSGMLPRITNGSNVDCVAKAR